MVSMNAEAQQLANDLARMNGENADDFVLNMLREKMAQKKQEEARIAEKRQKIDEILQHAWSLPILDHRTPEEIIGFDENGLPT